MKVLLYFENENLISVSGIGRARVHQMMALESQNIEYTFDPFDNYDILHINTYWLNSFPVIAKTRSEGRPVIYHAHSTEEDFRNSFILSNQISPIYKKYLINRYSSADEIITPTPYSKKILESYGIDIPINAISNGIILDRFKYDEEKIKAFRNYFGLNEKDKVVMGTGLLFERKGILDFFEVAKRLPEIKFIWFGHSSDLTIPAKITRAIDDKPFNVIMPGYVKGSIIEGAYLASDCFFFPSYEETEGIVVLEALASKQKLVLRDIGAYDPWLKDKRDCLLCHNNDEFVETILYAINNDLSEMRESGYKVAQERSIEKIGLQLKEVYERVYQNKYAKR